MHKQITKEFEGRKYCMGVRLLGIQISERDYHGTSIEELVGLRQRHSANKILRDRSSGSTILKGNRANVETNWLTFQCMTRPGQAFNTHLQYAFEEVSFKIS